MHAVIVHDVLVPRFDSRRAPVDPAHGPVVLGRVRHLRLTKARGWTVHVCAGTVWLTQDGDPRDTILRAGERFASEMQADVLVTALDDARVSLEPPRRLAWFGWMDSFMWLRTLLQKPRA